MDKVREDEFTRFYETIVQKEKQMDGSCVNEIICGHFPRHLMKKSGLIRYAGIKGKTRIVIEYDNDTGMGWRRIVTEDPLTISTQKDLLDNR